MYRDQSRRDGYETSPAREVLGTRAEKDKSRKSLPTSLSNGDDLRITQDIVLGWLPPP